MRDLDLEFRDRLLEAGKLNEGYDEEMEEIHLKNANRLNEIINEIGYPNVKKVGKMASDAAWLIIQHSISFPKFMIDCLELMQLELKNGDINPVNYAFLKDRILMFQGKPQSYGTQFEFDEDGKLRPYELDEPIVIINEKRKALGLNSVDERLDELQKENNAHNSNVRTKEKLKEEKLAFEKWRLKTGWIKKSRLKTKK